MFSKSIFIFGLLALFACQGATARSINELETRDLDDLIDQLKEYIAEILETGYIAHAQDTLDNLVETIAELKQKFLDEGHAAITGGIGNVDDFIKNKTQEAEELGIDIGKCVVGRDEELKQLRKGLNANLNNCVTKTVRSVLTKVNNDIKVINGISDYIITDIPDQMYECLTSSRPVSCMLILLKDLVSFLTSLPDQIAQIVKNAVDLVKALPEQLVGCVENIASSTASQTQAIIKDIGTCVDGLISNTTTTTTDATTTDATTTDATTTDATTTDATTTDSTTTDATTTDATTTDATTTASEVTTQTSTTSS